MMSLIIAIVFMLAGLGVLGGSAFEYIRAPYAQDQMIPVGTMIVGAIFLTGGAIALCIWATARKQLALLAKEAEPASPPAIVEGLAHLHATAKHANELLERILHRTGSPAKPPPSPLTLYYYADADMNAHGPFSGASLKEMLANGLITKETPVTVEGSEKWLPCSNFSELG